MNVRRSLRLSLCPIFIASAILAACGGDGHPSDADRWTGTVDTAANGRVTVTNTGGGAWRRDTVEARRTLLLGEAGVTGGSEETTFGEIIGLAVDREGRIFVGDRIGSTVRAYSPDGSHLGLVGGEGEGPGEFRWPEALVFGPEGRLFVAEIGGVTVMASPAPTGIPTEQVRSWQPVSRPQTYRPLRVTCGGRVYYPHQVNRPMRHFYLRIGSDGTVSDTVRVPEMSGTPSNVPWYRTGSGGGRMLGGVDHPPLAPVPSWDVTPEGRLLLGESSRYRLFLVAPGGDTVRTVRRRVERRAIPTEVRRESTEALRSRLDTLPVPVDDVNNLPDPVANLDLPSRYPAHLDVRVGQSGRVWVARPPLPDRPRAAPFDVFDRRGVFLGTVVVPGRFDMGRGFTNARSRPRPVFTDDAVYGVVTDSTTGVQRVARFSYELPEREDGAPGSPETGCSGRGLDL